MPDTQENSQDSLQNTQEKQPMNERTKELTDRLEAGMDELLQSDKYIDYLKAMSHFHHYSSRNIMLINMQLPGATRVGSFKMWEEKFNRHVKKGEKGIRIFAPIMTKETKEFEKLDPETKAPLLDSNGKVIKETLESDTLRFKLVPVFDQSQTYGDPLPELVENLTGNVTHYEAFMDSLRVVSPLPIEFEPLRDGNDGYCRYGEKIGIREGMSEVQTIAAIIHEIGHARLHDKGLENADVPKYVKETQAEGLAYVICQHYNIETAPNSFGYLASWGGRDMSEFKASLDVIRKEASGLINAIDDCFGQICQERGIDLAAKEPEKPVVPETPTESEFTTETENIADSEFQFNDVVPQTAVPEQASGKEEIYEITYWEMGTGTLALHYFNEGSERHGDYEELARIVPDRSVKFLKKDLPDEIKSEITDYALTADIPNMAADIPAETESMPDSSIGLSERDLYGYTYEGVLPLTQNRALELYDQDQPIYLLYPDNTEAIVLERSEIENHDGIFGIDRDEWQRTLGYTAQSAKNSTEAALESDLINGSTDMFAIYQLRDSEEMHYHRFASLKQLESDHLAVDRSNYELAYTAPLPTKETLDSIYQQFNIDRPKGFNGHSLSVSDVVVIQRGGEVSSHYVDNFGFAELSAFLGNERQPERTATLEQDDTASKKTPEKPTPVVEDSKTAPDMSERQDSDNKPRVVYMQSTNHARDNGELDRYRESLKLNKECASAIDAAIKDCIVPNGHGYLLTPESVRQVIGEYGEQRVNVVLANNVRLQEWDGRYSDETKAWAKGVEMPKVSDERSFFSASHPAVLDGYIRLARKETEKKPSVLEALKKGADKIRQNPSPLNEQQKNKGLEV